MEERGSFSSPLPKDKDFFVVLELKMWATITCLANLQNMLTLKHTLLKRTTKEFMWQEISEMFCRFFSFLHWSYSKTVVANLKKWKHGF